jgi:hypothetical protein
LLPPVEKERVGVEDKFAGSLRRQAPGPMIRQSPLCGYRNSGQVSRAEARDDASRSHQLRYPRQSRQNLVLSDGVSHDGALPDQPNSSCPASRRPVQIQPRIWDPFSGTPILAPSFRVRLTRHWSKIDSNRRSLLGPVRRARGHGGGPTRDAAGRHPAPWPCAALENPFASATSRQERRKSRRLSMRCRRRHFMSQRRCAEIPA